MDEETVRRLQEADWRDLQSRALLIARRLCGRYLWRGERNGHIPEGLEPYDLASLAISKTIAGKRTWRHAEKDLMEHLIDVMRSEISNHSRKAEHAAAIPYAYNQETNSSNPYYALSAVIAEEGVEEMMQQAIFISQVCDHIGNHHPDLIEITRAITKLGIHTNRDLAAELKCTVDEVINQKRRLRRALHGFAGHDKKRIAKFDENN